MRRKPLLNPARHKIAAATVCAAPACPNHFSRTLHIMIKFPQDKLSQSLRDQLQCTEKMNRLMDGVCGPGNWIFDEKEDVWVTPNTHGPGFVVVRRGGDWFVSDPPRKAMS
jgi:hypothetical protein